MWVRLNISNETKNRLIVWYACLQRAADALTTAGYFQRKLHEETSPIFLDYKICFTNRSISPYHGAIGALYTEAIMLFGQVFKPGNRGNGISANNNKEIDEIRHRIITEAKTALSWDDTKYLSVYNSIMTKRDKFGAHYDGSHADYNEAGGVLSFRSPGIWFDQNENVDEFKILVDTLYCVINSIVKYRS